MEKKTIIILSLALFILALLLLSFKIEQDPLHKRLFTISLSETKNGVVAKKPIQDRLFFKNGSLRSDFLYKKFGYKFLKYRINKDSIFTDSTDTEVRWLEVEAIITDDKNQTIFVSFVTCEWDIDGTIKITKNDKIKRYYDFAGREKGGKPKKEKKKKNKEAESEILK